MERLFNSTVGTKKVRRIYFYFTATPNIVCDYESVLHILLIKVTASRQWIFEAMDLVVVVSGT